jgi:cation:H+ antiporter
MVYLLLFGMLVLIVVAAEVFTNALENLGERLGISEGVTGSVLAAIGTALPETMVPVLALVAGTANHRTNEEISVGAILGAPLMLSTVSAFFMSVAAFARRGPKGEFRPERTGLRRDLDFFILSFLVSSVALFLPQKPPLLRFGLGAALVSSYLAYLLLTLRASSRLVKDGHGTEAHEPLLLEKLGLPGSPAVLGLQFVAGLALLVAGAKGFISGVEEVSQQLGVSALLISLLVIPVATELPETLNSFLWIRRRKDTLAFGNVTGAMVFQGTLLPAIGVVFTAWAPYKEALLGVGVTMFAALWLRLLSACGPFRVWQLGVNGLLYAAYLVATLS